MTKLETKIRDIFRYNNALRKYRKEDPLKHTYILKERGCDYGALYWQYPLDGKGMFIEAYVTDGGIQSCGLYFKVGRFGMDGGVYSGEAKMLDLCRISMERPEYITGFNETFKLTEDQKCKMIEVLNTKSETCGTVWNHIFMMLNLGRDYTKKFPKIEVLPMPDYSKLPL